jgi:glycosyltransferase involved in cell wall biosynthesis
MTRFFKVIVGICAYNEEKTIGGLLSSLLNQSLSNFILKKIIVVASGCTDRTEDIVREFAKKSEGLIELISEKERKGKLSALNIIMRRAKEEEYDYLVLANADIICEKETLQKVLQPLLLDESVYATCAGPLPCTNSSDLISFIVRLVWFMHNEIAIRRPFLSGELLALRRGLVERFPSFAPWEDIYITALLSRKELKYVFVNDAIVYMKKLPSSLSEVLRQQVRYQTGNLHIKKILGYSKPTLSFSFVVRIMPEVVRKFGLLRIPHYIVALLIYLSARLCARFNLFRNRIPFRW